MAATSFTIAPDFSEHSLIPSSKVTTIKSLSESGLSSLPSSFACKNLHDIPVLDSSEDNLPVEDFSLLVSSDSDQRRKAIKTLAKLVKNGAASHDIGFVYFKRIREIIKELLRGVSDSLGLEPNYICKAMDLESSFQVFIAYLYLPCPDPELAVGIHPHSDHGLLTILTESFSGLQTQYNGKWVNVNAPPNALMVNTANLSEVPNLHCDASINIQKK